MADALDGDFDTPEGGRRAPRLTRRGQLDLLARGLAVFGLAIDRTQDVPPPETHRRAMDRQAEQARRDYAEADQLPAGI